MHKAAVRAPAMRNASTTRVPSRAMHAKRSQAPPPPPAKPAARAAPPPAPKPTPAAAPSSQPQAAPTPRAEARAEARTETSSRGSDAAAQVLAKNISRVAGTGLKGADLLGRLLASAEKANADVAATVALFRQTVRSPSLAPILEEAAALPGKEARDFLTGKLPDLAPEVRRVISTAIVNGASLSTLTDAVSLLDTVEGTTAKDNLVLVMCSSEQRARYWQAQLNERLTQQIGQAPHYVFVPRPGDVDEFDLPNGASLTRDNGATEAVVRSLLSEESSALDADLEGLNGRLQSLQPWVDPSKAAEELETLSRSKYARMLNVQLLRPKA